MNCEKTDLSTMGTSTVAFRRRRNVLCIVGFILSLTTAGVTLNSAPLALAVVASHNSAVFAVLAVVFFLTMSAASFAVSFAGMIVASKRQTGGKGLGIAGVAVAASCFVFVLHCALLF